MNTFGQYYRLTSFGESHGPAIGGVIDGVPPGEAIDCQTIQTALDRRRPGSTPLGTQRREADQVQLLSGIYQGVTLGTPIAFVIPNSNQRSSDYDTLQQAYRPSHADYTYTAKYGHADLRGGGRASARETACRVVAGAVAAQILQRRGITIRAYTQAIGKISIDAPYSELSLEHVYDFATRCPLPDYDARMAEAIQQARSQGDTLGGIVGCVISGLPVGLGEPLADKLQARLAAAMMSIPAAKGFEYGMGFDGASALGSEVIDLFTQLPDGSIGTISNHSGGLQGGITNGQDIYLRVAFKPIATLLRDLPTVDRNGQPTTLHMRGRHDVSAVPRAVPVVEAMAAMTILDAMMAPKLSN